MSNYQIVYAQCLGFMQKRRFCMGEKGLMRWAEWKLSNERQIFATTAKKIKERAKKRLRHFNGAAYI